MYIKYNTMGMAQYMAYKSHQPGWKFIAFSNFPLHVTYDNIGIGLINILEKMQVFHFGEKRVPSAITIFYNCHKKF